MIIASSFNWPPAHQHSGWLLIPTDLKAPGLKTQINLIPDCPPCGIRNTRNAHSQARDLRRMTAASGGHQVSNISNSHGTNSSFSSQGTARCSRQMAQLSLFWWPEVFIHELVGLTSTQWGIPRGQIWAMSVCGIVTILYLRDPDQHFQLSS